MALTDMTTEEIMHWVGELVGELARRAAPQPQASLPPWMQAPAPAPPPPPAWQPPRQEPRHRPFTASQAPVNLAPMPAGGLPPGTPLTQAAQQAAPAVDPVAALVEQFRAQLVAAGTPTQAPARAVVTTTAKTDPETARVFLSVPPRPEGSPPINGGSVSGGVVLEPGG